MLRSRYVNWSEVELVSSKLSERTTTPVDSDASASRTRLFSGHASTICDLQWWFPSMSPIETVCSHQTIGLSSEVMIVTSSADGKIRVWDSETRELVSQLQVQAIAQLGAIASRTSDSINQIRFTGPTHLIMGTKSGLLILIAITPLQTSTKLTVTRVMKDHAIEGIHSHGILALDVYSHPLSQSLHRIEQELDTCQLDRAVNFTTLTPDGSNKKQSAIYKQANLSTLSEESLSENAERWIWLALGEAKRLSLWMLVDRVTQNDAVGLHKNPQKFARCHLIRWIVLDSLRIFGELLPQIPDQIEKCLTSFEFRAAFVQPNLESGTNSAFSCTKSHSQVSVLDAPQIAIHAATGRNSSKLFFYSVFPKDAKLSHLQSPVDLPERVLSVICTNSVSSRRCFVLISCPSHFELLCHIYDYRTQTNTGDWIPIVTFPKSLGSSQKESQVSPAMTTTVDEQRRTKLAIGLGSNLFLLEQ
ncbi:uncharacterized protein DEA37_0008625 [Paragonimus westermani]|uniref:Uncharacterized protein n=1 Tax=Paragonimus westermani TaxID=34504 RepID=A0A5J4NTN2_9TREM|nr:uncharacterized protein DEA37_0008625 [Paragonimus westermani]